MRGILSLGLLILAGGASLAQADVYRWVDAQGSVHYSDRWVEGSELIKTTKSAVAMAAAARAAEDQAKLSATSSKIDADLARQASERAMQADVAKARAEQCKQAKTRYEQVVQARRIFRTNAKGEREYLSDPEMTQQRLEAREIMDDVCGPKR